MNPGAAAGVVVLGVVALYAGLIFYGLKEGQRRTPASITERVRTASEPVYVKVSPFEFAWNPITGRRDVDQKLRGPGWANYRLDEEGLVHFEFRHKTGRVVTHVGAPAPLPEPASPPKVKPQHLAAGVLVAYLLFAVAGLVVGLSLAPASARFAAATVGALLGWLAGYVVLMFVTIALRSRARTRGPKSQA